MPKTTAAPKVAKKAPVKKAVSKKPASSSEFAVIATGGKQYRVSVGDTIKIEALKGTYAEGAQIVFDKVLLVDNGKDTSIGTPYIDKAKVEGTLRSIGRAKKVEVIKYRAKSNYFKRNGHRQPFFEVVIDRIS